MSLGRWSLCARSRLVPSVVGPTPSAWRHLQTVYDLTRCQGDSEPHVTVMGDMALVTWERMLMDTQPKDGGPVRHRRMRGTEVYRRDDGDLGLIDAEG